MGKGNWKALKLLEITYIYRLPLVFLPTSLYTCSVISGVNFVYLQCDWGLGHNHLLLGPTNLHILTYKTNKIEKI